jgi:cytochrome b
MDGQNMTRIVLEGALNGIGFVIGSALVGLIVSIFLILAHHLTMLIALPIIGIVFWVSFKGRRLVKARLDRAKLEEFTRALGPQ